MNALEKRIREWLDTSVDRELARQTRCHPLPSSQNGNPVYIKREDELSSGICGAKLRKYASLLPSLAARGVRDAAMIGGPNSNNLVGLVQLLTERGIKAWLFVREAVDQSLSGNALFLHMLTDPEQTRRIPRAKWSEVETLASQFLSKRTNGFLVPEGALCPESLPGAMTLATEVIRHERELSAPFDRIYIDSGTGMSACGLLIGLACLDPQAADRQIFVTLVAGTQSEFLQTLQRLGNQLAKDAGLNLPPIPRIQFLTPPTARKYGSVNQTLLKTCRQIAREEGLLMDPTYSVKHYMAMRRNEKELPSGRVLFIYNGGSLGLGGFQDKLARFS